MGIAIIILISICIILLIINLFKNGKINSASTNKNQIALFNEKLEGFIKVLEVKNEFLFEKINLKIETADKEINNIKKLNIEFYDKFLKENNEEYQKIQNLLSNEIKEFNKQIKETFKEFEKTTKESLDKLEKTINDNLKTIRDDNSQKLDKINLIVNEKLEKTLESRLKQSFDNVVEQISGVNKAIGEIKGLASDVGSLKTVLTNVKTKGIVGEVILGNIIKDILTIGQYEENYPTKKGSTERVEFAIKMPGNNDEYIYLPIDSKLPLESYHKIKDGTESGNIELIKDGRKELKSAIKKYAKDISDKYIDVPNTTDFAIMFLPIEGLYVEVLDLGLFEEIQREYKVNIAGPTTLTAILNALQMGFKTLVIQKKSSDVFKLLGAVKTEFSKFAETLEKTQKKVTEASNELDKLVGTRTRMIQTKLKNIQSLDESETINIIED